VLPVGAFVGIVVVAILLSSWVTFTLTRLDRLHARVDAAQAALDAQLVRRAAALERVTETAAIELPAGQRERYAALARAALQPGQDPGTRRGVENAVGRAVADLASAAPTPEPAAVAELREAAARVLIARRFYNDAVRDTRSLRSRRLPRLLHMAGRRAMPEFFDIDDTPPPRAPRPAPAAAPTTVPATTPAPTTEEDRP